MVMTSARWLAAHQGTDAVAGAQISNCGTYRYNLWRRWGPAPGAMIFVMLNPSTADHATNDPTIRRCIGFAAREGFEAIRVVNLFALRATDPSALGDHPDPVGPDNRHYLDVVAAQASQPDYPCKVVFGWGANVAFGSGPDIAADQIFRAWGHEPLCFGTTQKGNPKHPLYIPADHPLHLFPEIKP